MAFTEHIKVALGLKSDDFKNGLTGAESKTKTFGKNVKGYLAGALGTAIFIKTTKAIVDFGATIGDVSDRLGVSAEFLQKWQYSATQSGSSAEEADKAMEKLSKSIGEASTGTKLYQDAFERLGVELKDANGNLKSTEQVVMEVADGLKDTKDDAVRVKTAFDLMGRGGTAMIQVMQDGSQGLKDFGKEAEDMGLIVGNDNVKALQDASGQIEKMNTKWKVFLAEIATPVVTAFDVILVGLNGVKLLMESIPTIIETFGATFEKVFVNVVRQGIIDVKVKLAELKLGFAEFNPFADDADIKKYQDNLDILKDKQHHINNETKDWANARNEVLVADEKLFKKNNDFAEKQKELQNQMIDIFTDKEKKQKDITKEVGAEKDKVVEIVGARSEEEQQVQRVLDKVNAMKRGGLDALQVVQDRHDMEDKINKLMKDGNLDREEAERLAKKIKDAEQDELDLQEDIKDEKKEQVRLKKEKEDRDKLLADLEKEKQLRQDINDIDDKINEARKKGDKRAEDILEKQKILRQLGEAELEDRDELGRKLMDELKQKKDIRDVEQKKLDILQLRANGQDDLAEKLQRELDMKNDIKDVVEDLEITESEAIQHIERKLELEKDIELSKNQQEQTSISDASIRETASKNIHDAETREEKRRIQASQAVIRLEGQIEEMKKRSDNYAKSEVERLEALKVRKMELALDDKTREELENLRNAEEEINTGHKDRMDELQAKLQDVQKEEDDLKQKQKDRLDEIEKKKDDILDKEKEILEEGKKELKEQGEEVVDALEKAGDAIKEKIEDIKNNDDKKGTKTISDATLQEVMDGLSKLKYEVHFSNTDKADLIQRADKAQTTLDSILQEIIGIGETGNNASANAQAIANEIASTLATALGEIKIPNPTTSPIVNNIEISIDTEDLAKESTLISIDNKLEGKLKNE